MNKYLRRSLFGLQFCALVLGGSAFEVAREAHTPERYIQSYREGFVKEPGSGLLGTLTMWRKRMVILVLKYEETPDHPRLPTAFSAGYNSSFFEELGARPAHSKYDQILTICQADGKAPLVERTRVNGNAYAFENDVERLDFGDKAEVHSDAQAKGERVARYYSGSGAQRGFSLLESSRMSWRWLAPREDAPGRAWDSDPSSCHLQETSASRMLTSVSEALSRTEPDWALVRESGRSLTFTLEKGRFLAGQATVRYSLTGESDEMHRDYELVLAQLEREGLKPWSQQQSRLTSDVVQGGAWRDDAVFRVGNSRLQVTNSYNQGKPSLHVYYSNDWYGKHKIEDEKPLIKLTAANP